MVHFHGCYIYHGNGCHGYKNNLELISMCTLSLLIYSIKPAISMVTIDQLFISSTSHIFPPKWLSRIRISRHRRSVFVIGIPYNRLRNFLEIKAFHGSLSIPVSRSIHDVNPSHALIRTGLRDASQVQA